MSLKINKDNIYVIVPLADESKSMDNFMEENFTIFVRVKLFKDDLPINEESFFFSRNGKHSGISTRKINDKLIISFSYWFSSENDKNIYKNVVYELPTEIENEFNDYLMICDHKINEIYCYVNGKNIGTISYNGLIKENYSKSFVWFGCGSMIVEKIHKGIGNFEYSLSFALSDKISVDSVNNIKSDYKEFINTSFADLPILSDEMYFKDKMFFFLDFNHKTKYKIWNFIFNGVYPQLYIENNIYF